MRPLPQRIALHGIVLSLLIAASAAPAPAARPVVVRETLATGGADSDARGHATLIVSGRGGRLVGKLGIKVSRLEGRAVYAVTIDGVPVGTLSTSRAGKGRARFATSARSGRQLLGVDPRGRTLGIVSTDGAVVLAAAVSDDSIDPADVRCCLPDDSGDECEDRTPAECAAAGGVDLGPGSCLPSPCATVPPPDGDVRCCLPDDSGSECEDRTPAECAAQGGINVGAGACTPNACGAGGPTSTTLPPGVVLVRVRCERSGSRSKISVDGSGLAAGVYRAKVTSTTREAVSDPQAAVGDEAEFDFDSDPGDIAQGAAPIASDFIQGSPPSATGRLLDAANGVVASATAICTLR